MYPLILHKTMTMERWANYPIYKRILMIGNEMQRLQHNIEHGNNQVLITETLERTMELTDLTIETTNGNLRKELLRWREMLSLAYCEKENLPLNKTFINQLHQILFFFTPESALIY